MSKTPSVPLPPNPTLEHAEHVWHEWEYRHMLFWSAFSRWGAAVLLVNYAPFLSGSIYKTAMRHWWLFPVVAALLTLFGTYHILAEMARHRKVGELLNALRASVQLQVPELSAGSRYERVLAHRCLRIDSVMAAGFLIGGLGVCCSWAFLRP